MIERIINDINKALNAEAYLAALSLVLTLPDICAKAEYGDFIGNKERFIKWYDEYIGDYENPQEDNMPYLSGEVVYQLRCFVLHQGTPNIDKEKIKEESCKIDKFVLVVEKNSCGIYADSAFVIYTDHVRGYEVNIRRLCFIITTAAKKYYNDNQTKFNFFKFEIIDRDEEIKKLFGDNK